eukprot:PhF_6_TR10012/c0_g1_i3/m.15295
MVAIVESLLCVLAILSFTSASRCPEGIVRLSFEPNGIVFSCPPPFKHNTINIRAVCTSGNGMIDPIWMVCEDPYGQCVTVSCNSTHALQLRSNIEDHRLVITAGKEIRGIEMTITSFSRSSSRFLPLSSPINDTFRNDTNTTTCTNAPIISGSILENLIPCQWINQQTFYMSSSQISGTIPS